MKRRGTFLSVGHPRFSVDYLGRIILVIAGLVLLSGCSSTTSRVQTWEGDAENAGQVAVLPTPGSIKVREVNGQPMTSFLIDDLAVEYELLPGENRIEFTYKTIWAKAEARENGESNVHIVETPRQVVAIDAEPGAAYRFEIGKPETRQQAEALAKDFSVALVNASGQTVATSTPWSASEGRPAVKRAPVPESQSAEALVEAASATTLERLKALWGTASEEEKREFLRWAFE